MIKGIIVCLIAAILIGNFVSFQSPPKANPRTAKITGKISPENGATTAWLIGERDSLKADLNEGTFSMVVRPGNYQLVIGGGPAYASARLSNLSLKNGEVLDAGEIILPKN